jgi:hypothetical protein
MSSPNCNYSTLNGEFYSKKIEENNKLVKENDKKFKIYSLCTYLSILIFLISIFLFIVIFKKNKDLMSGNLKDSTNNIPQSAWSIGVIISLIFSLVSLGSGIFCGIFMNKYKKKISIPIIQDETRPCYSVKNKILLEETKSSPVTINAPPPSISSSIIKSSAGKISGEQDINSDNSITGTGLDKVQGINVKADSIETTEAKQNEIQLDGLNLFESGKNTIFNQSQFVTS